MHITQLLKEATSKLHHQTETLMPIGSILGGEGQLDDYAMLLSRQYPIYQSLETHLADTIRDPGLAVFFHNKHQWLAMDLAQMGYPVPVPLTDAHPDKGTAFNIGVLYVLEGSMLGGQVILKMIKKATAIQGLPHHFYSGYGEKTGERWMDFKALATELVRAPEDTPLAIAGAEYAFSFFIRSLQAKL